MYYRPTPELDPEKIRVKRLNGKTLQDEIRGVVDKILDDERSDNPPLASESLVITIDGEWGSGKTTAAWALVNHLKEKSAANEIPKPHVYDFNLLPFGNINESLENILNTIARGLWSGAALDVREEFRRLLIDATPKYDVSAGISLFGFKLSRNVTLPGASTENQKRLVDKFSYFRGKGQKLVVMIDDLDRMAPEEVVAVIRMIEGLKKIPGVIFILPFYRPIVASSIGQCLGLSEADSHVYLRKFTKGIVDVGLGLDNLKYSFTKELGGVAEKSEDKVHGLKFANFAWYLFLHIAILKEAPLKIMEAETEISLQEFLVAKSSYTQKMLEHFQGEPPNSERQISVWTGKEWERISHKYNALSELSRNLWPTGKPVRDLQGGGLMERCVRELSYLQGEVDLGLPICKKTTMKDNTMVCICEAEGEPEKHRTILSEIILPEIQRSRNEPLVSGKYTRRDMEQMATIIKNCLIADPISGATESEYALKLAGIVHEKFREFSAWCRR